MSDADSTEIAEIAVDTDRCWHVDSCEITSRLQDIGTFQFQRPENGYQKRPARFSLSTKQRCFPFRRRTNDCRTCPKLPADVTKQRQHEPKDSHQSTTSSFLGFCSATALAAIVAKGRVHVATSKPPVYPKCDPRLFYLSCSLHVSLASH